MFGVTEVFGVGRVNGYALGAVPRISALSTESSPRERPNGEAPLAPEESTPETTVEPRLTHSSSAQPKTSRLQQTYPSPAHINGPKLYYRIAMVAACPFPANRGTPARIFHMADELARRGHHVDVVAYHLGDEGRPSGFRLHRIGKIKTYKKLSPGPTLQKLLIVDFCLATKLVGLLWRGRYDVIHAHHFEGLLAALPARLICKIPLVFDMHTILETELPFYHGRWAGLLERTGRILDRNLPGRADRVIAISEEIRVRLIEYGIPADIVSVVPNGVEEPFFDAEPPPAAMMGRLTSRRLVFAGNLAPYQGIDLLLKAFANCCWRRPGLRLRILSDSPFATYEALATELGVRDAIELVRANLDDLPTELAAADVLLNPRVTGAGLPQKMLNYMAAGRPIVSFAGTARYLEHERNALVVADHDINGFADAILRLIGDRALAKRLGDAARGVAREQLSWSRTAQGVEDVYARLPSRCKSS
jgi:glycosyltransferase involved in cell wall biosynthesis